MKKTEGDAFVTTLLSLIVIFTAMINPSLALIVAVTAFIALSVYKYTHIKEDTPHRPFIASAIIACLFVLSYGALHDILKGKETNYAAEYAVLAFCAVVLLFIVRSMLRTSTNKPVKKKKAKK